MDRRQILIGLHESPGMGWKSVERIIHSGEIEHALDFKMSDWVEKGLSETQASRMATHFTESWIQERAELHQSKGIHILTIDDENYPTLMKESIKPAWVLYAKGKLELLSSMSIAMVGTRIPTAYGKKVASLLTEDLCARGVTVVSGMARGIDGVCHEAALGCQGQTIAVMGTAIDMPYPSEHHGLYKRIAKDGLIVSEYPSGTASHPGLFPQRNRIIAGLTRGTVVVEADLRSGSLITADAAMESNRDVFAVPGQITSPKSVGTLGLIRQGAKLITSAQDILDEYNQADYLCFEERNSTKKQPELTEQEKHIYHMLEQGSIHFDGLISRTAWDFGLLHSVLLSLIIKKQVVQLPGSLYKLI
ncbi:DNA processing protein [Paenibacillus shirakamiensis]|uniref:DNA processing protein n=1 Tax=Paenibacillus shirakamiensis TaxID=1265935 RepID=A0ABS4JJ38_9BACL|nr:DNA-processing protein DprA [Paenibacillus shirakamiensis]MBP2001130.1 DNA processing protein [Paenibacillus shirakamiensis]